MKTETPRPSRARAIKTSVPLKLSIHLAAKHRAANCKLPLGAWIAKLVEKALKAA